MSKRINVALIGNPNTGKTSVFNQLTGLNQKVGNYPGITVEKKEGICRLSRNLKAHILDLPGTYSLNSTSLDESVAVELLLNKNDKDYPDVAVVIADVENLKRNLLLFTQIKDLNIPTLLVINMADQMTKRGIQLDIEQLEIDLDTKIALVSTRKGEGIDQIKQFLIDHAQLSTQSLLNPSCIDSAYFAKLKNTYPKESLYKLWLVITQDVNFSTLEKTYQTPEATFETKSKADLKRLQQRETILRYQLINNALKKSLVVDQKAAKGTRERIDRILTHKVFGYLIFLVILSTIFQAIYTWSSIPMDWIDSFFAQSSDWIKATLPPGVLTNLLAEGVMAGIGGIVIFVPQIAFLFLFISLLEESGYMSRVVFLMDRLMRPFGLSGKSLVPLISGTACAIPAVMATRTIEDWKERLITILVTPFTTCSARLPVYLIVISLVIPQTNYLGLSLQALTLMALYALGFIAALLAAALLNKTVKVKKRTLFVVEMPHYKMPLFKNVALTVVEKTKSFVLGAGKIILALSIVLWFMGSNGWSEAFQNAEQHVQERPEVVSGQWDQTRIDQEVSSYKLEHSLIGQMGKTIEPVVRPLGFDWKMGIAIITSFAAREVFVGTLATLYAVGSDEGETIKQRMGSERDPVTGAPLFNLASGISLLLFYAFAMQCMSTLAVVKRETNSWYWPSVQLVFMSSIAYVLALIAYQTLS